MQTISPTELTALAELVFTTDRFLFVKGQGGSGKTSILCNQVGPDLGREVWLVNLSGQGPQEVIGYGIPQPDGDMKFAAPTIWPTAERVGDRPVLLVLDELPDYDSEFAHCFVDCSLHPVTGMLVPINWVPMWRLL